jgi:hypothetical protein
VLVQHPSWLEHCQCGTQGLLVYLASGHVASLHMLSQGCHLTTAHVIIANDLIWRAVAMANQPLIGYAEAHEAYFCGWGWGGERGLHSSNFSSGWLHRQGVLLVLVMRHLPPKNCQVKQSEGSVTTRTRGKVPVYRPPPPLMPAPPHWQPDQNPKPDSSRDLTGDVPSGTQDPIVP